jgi:SAM-dependent methyltransferase
VRKVVKRTLMRLGLYEPLWRIRGWLRRHSLRTSIRNRRWRRAHDEPLPIPPPALIWEVVNHADIGDFLAAGRERAGAIESAFAAAGFELGRARRVLDFGCGCGRILRHFANRSATEWYASDVNERLVSWCRDNLPFAHCATNGLLPPLAFADRFFDAVYAISVLTHLDESLQERWLAELERIVDPGGAVLVTTHGDAWLGGLDASEAARYRSGAIVVRSAHTASSNVCEAYHPPAGFRRLAGRHFADVHHFPQGRPGQRAQDVWVLRRPIQSPTGTVAP